MTLILPPFGLHMGFTGTAQGMTTRQLYELKLLVSALAAKHDGPFYGHHGDCVGADAQFHDVLIEFGFEPVIHPPTNPKARARCTARYMMPERPYIARNHAIVNATSMLLATPKTRAEMNRSGTWATVRYARKRGKPVYLVYPNGDLDFEPSEGE